MNISGLGLHNLFNLNNNLQKSPFANQGESDGIFANRNMFDTVTFSSNEVLRNIVSTKQTTSFDEMLKSRELLTEIRLSPDIDYSYALSNEINSLNAESSEKLSVSSASKNVLKAYSNLYDEIVKGYENGTRKINVSAENEQGYRTLTMEEELANLDNAYQKAVKSLEVRLTEQPKIEQAILDYQKKLEELGVKKAEAMENYANSLKEELPENFAKNLLLARDDFKENYISLQKSSALENALSLVMNMFSKFWK